MIIGVHCSKKAFPSLVDAIKDKFDSISDEKESLIGAIQIHTHGPRNTSARKINAIKIIEVMKSHNAKLFIHTSHLTYPWKDTSFHLKHADNQIRSANQLNADGIVFHLAKLSPIKLMPVIKKLIKMNHESGNRTTILLEMVSQKPNTYSYETPEKINKLTNELTSKNISDKQVGICIDTSHIFVNPDVKIRNYADAKQYLSKLTNISYIKLFHINGNCLEGYRDCHTLPFNVDDLIWHGISYKQSGLRAFTEYAEKNNIPMILEINVGIFKDGIKTLILHMRSVMKAV